MNLGERGIANALIENILTVSPAQNAPREAGLSTQPTASRRDACASRIRPRRRSCPGADLLVPEFAQPNI